MMQKWKYQPKDILQQSKIVPVIVIHDLDDAIPLATALIEGGIGVLEVTLRTSCALDAIQLLSKRFPDVFIGAGTVINEKTYLQAIEAGSQFVITPGLTTSLLQQSKEHHIPLIPGVSNISNILLAMEYEYQYFKFFPAEINGGVKALKAFEGPLETVRFCPTGGINEINYMDYLSLNNVECVGGSWICSSDDIKAKNWEKIYNLTLKSMHR